VEPVIGDPLIPQAIEVSRLDLAAERRWQSGTRVVDEDDEDVRRVVG
jgi:hypothetical protein